MNVTAKILEDTGNRSHSDYTQSPTVNHHLDARILMIDDEPIMTDVIQGLLEEAGYNNFSAIADPTLAMPSISENTPDLILLDLKMPKISGFEILTEIRKSPALQFLPVIVLTSSTDAENKLRALEYGATDFLGKPVDPSELILRLRNTLAAKAYQDRLAFTDEATGLPNGRVFVDEVNQGMRSALSSKTKLAVIKIAIDRLKQVNESFGPRIGDLLIQQVAQRLLSASQGNLDDTHHGARGEVTAVARLSGNEFGLLVAGLPRLGDTDRFSNRYCHRLSGTYIVDGEELFVSARAGISGFPDDGDNAELIIENASAALMQLQSAQGQVSCFFSREANAQAKARINQETQLRKAVTSDEMELYFQPKIGVQSGQITGAEALLRWDNPTLGRVSPADFIPLAEESGLIVPIGSWVLRRAIETMADWRTQGATLLPISVNVSPIQFVRPSFSKEVHDLVCEFELDPALFTLEITETVFFEGGSDIKEVMRHLQNIGFKLSIDDFGTGYSSLAYLKEYPVNELKIDRSFIEDIDGSNSESSIVSAIVALGKGLNLQVVAEGVETEAQLAALRASKCDQFQGFLNSKPMPAQRFFEMLR